MKTCATCRFAAPARPDRLRLLSELHDSPHQHCVRIIHGNRDDEATADTVAFVADGSGYAAALLVLPTFGCVLHEERSVARRAPVQGEGNYWLRKGDPRRAGTRCPGTVAWSEHVEAWTKYSERYGAGQSAERVAERGGFGYSELVDLLGHAPATWLVHPDFEGR
jgi:hypothetical protein